MEYRVKRISTAGIAEAIAKAELYRSLSEPEEAESICRDILTIEPQHQLALRLLGLPDRSVHRSWVRSYREAEEIFQQLNDRMNGTTTLGSRTSDARKRSSKPGNCLLTVQALRTGSYLSQRLRNSPAENDDAILRWNRCVRLLQDPAYEWGQSY